MASGEWHCEKRFKNESFRNEDENVLETGCLSIIVLGASGDLAKKKTFPALFNLYGKVYFEFLLSICLCHECYILCIQLVFVLYF